MLIKPHYDKSFDVPINTSNSYFIPFEAMSILGRKEIMKIFKKPVQDLPVSGAFEIACALIQDYVNLNREYNGADKAHMRKAILDEWRQYQAELVRAHGIANTVDILEHLFKMAVRGEVKQTPSITDRIGIT